MSVIVIDEVVMFNCNGCGREFGTKQATTAHWGYCPMKGKVKLELPPDNLTFDEMTWWRKRIFLLEKAGHKCSICGFSKTREDGRGILEIDHIDADHTNNTIENLRVLCPNCHAMTSNFRNWGRKTKKSSKRFRKGNTGFEESRAEVLAEKIQKRDELDSKIISIVLETFESGVINYRKWGWIGRLNDFLTKEHNMMFTQQTIGRKVKELMPTFYIQNCHKRL
jgi:hypothetical protein